MVDALSRKKVIAYINALSKVISDFNERIKHTAKHDATYGRLRQQVKEGGLRRELLRETLDAKWVGHPSEEMTLALLVRSYYWPKMGEDVQTYVKSCLVCQMDKTERKKAVGFSKYYVLYLLLKHVLRNKLLGHFWVELFKLLGSELKFSTANHSQTDRQTEMINALLKEYLRHYRSSTTGMNPFELAIGVQPRMPLEVAKQKVGNRVLLKLTPQIWKKTSSKIRQKGLIPKYDESFELSEDIP
ncbi:hypothetical protein CK203_082282 [Vitis vinifera]|uniref:Integrase zinc-binding domain-containing protein n=1 Tax=Vitis vinifera TaxID=29760 RepID=A0A438EQT3_VITVI|nr:hypothetical protein CK203_082282 [Vitis vinifera]